MNAVQVADITGRWEYDSYVTLQHGAASLGFGHDRKPQYIQTEDWLLLDQNVYSSHPRRSSRLFIVIGAVGTNLTFVKL